MNPGLVVKLRPTGPWRIGPDSGARNRVDVIYHSDSLFSAITAAMARMGSLEAWLDATARSVESEVCFASAFPFQEGIHFVVPPRTIWPPTSPAAMSARVRWKSARFVPLEVVQSVLAGRKLDGNKWNIDGASECLVPAGSAGPFRTGVRWNAAVDRLTGAVERHSTACIEFRAGCGLWTTVSFRDEAAQARWSDPVKAAFRLLADSGFGGERSRGWGRAESPEFTEGALPDLILPSIGSTGDLVAGEPEPVEQPPVVEQAPNPPEAEGPVLQVTDLPVENPPVAEQVTDAPTAESAPDSVAAEPEPAAAEQAPELPAEEPPAQSPVEAQTAEPALEPTPDPFDAAPESPSEPEPLPEASVQADSPIRPLVVEPTPPTEPDPQSSAAPEQPQAVIAVMEMEEQTQEAVEAVVQTEPEPAPVVGQIVAAHPGPQAHWLLSLYTPSPGDTVDWARGNYAVLARGGRVDSPAGAGELKKQIQMVAEGSVVYAETAPGGLAPNVAPDGFAHPVYRAGFALAIPLPEVR